MDEVRRLADAVLYEGHVLWPYRRSSIKNRQRWTFGGVYPSEYARTTADRSAVQIECLVEGARPVVDVAVRCLQAVHRQAVRGASREPVDELPGHLTWDEATERSFTASVGSGEVRRAAMDVAEGSATEPVDGGALVRTWERLVGHVEASVDPLTAGLHRVRVRIVNECDSPQTDRDSAVRRTFLSAHAVLRAREGEFVSSTDPPDNLRPAVDALHNEGLWPVLVGAQGDRSTMLAAPIILEDYARVAPESPGDFFDGGEIDQLLVLNLLGLTDDEKRELRAGDPRAREILDRTEAMTDEQMARLSGAIRDLRPAAGV
ncbi:MAG: hypothetical protein ACJ76I_15410 [Gaiellaceae bacterium]